MLEKIKRRLNITWDYDNEEIGEIIEEGKAFIVARVGEVEFDLNPLASRLLKEYCRYAWNGSVAYFEQNFRSDILNLQIQNAIQ
ncbi:hypothetical protein NSA24_10485 [Clostridioides mangenotii]|uniref:hypothetical protein n=1 Tax=Metaclostridioides mangenotii TaxID=1540 RepID=UPI002149A665|nr:hypothetical protein [Clostridioides mangenotii]MCR1955219.1 hypothetical protein [Clostridioides mangenotii]